jgi:hypothetical protein
MLAAHRHTTQPDELRDRRLHRPEPPHIDVDLGHVLIRRRRSPQEPSASTTGVTDTFANAVIATGATMRKLMISTSGPSSANACETISTSGPSSGTEVVGHDRGRPQATRQTRSSRPCRHRILVRAPAAGVSVVDVDGRLDRAAPHASPCKPPVDAVRRRARHLAPRQRHDTSRHRHGRRPGRNRPAGTAIEAVADCADEPAELLALTEYWYVSPAKQGRPLDSPGVLVDGDAADHPIAGLAGVVNPGTIRGLLPAGLRIA